MASTAKRVRFIELWGQLCAYAAERGIQYIVWTYDRSPQEQNDLYKRGRTTPGPIVTNADGFVVKSAHQHWLAIDIAIIKNGEVILCELKSSMSKSDMYVFARKVEYYQRRHGRPVQRRIVVSPMVHPSARPVADRLGIEIFSYAEDTAGLQTPPLA